jgi:hypothetical protein
MVFVAGPSSFKVIINTISFAACTPAKNLATSLGAVYLYAAIPSGPSTQRLGLRGFHADSEEARLFE